MISYIKNYSIHTTNKNRVSDKHFTSKLLYIQKKSIFSVMGCHDPGLFLLRSNGELYGFLHCIDPSSGPLLSWFWYF